MSREIKFRAWCKEGKQMYYDCLPLGGWANWWIAFDDDKKYDGEFTVGEDIEVMQFTGLKDKNGVEIYEGDIIYLKHETGYETWDEEKEVVKFELGSFSCGIYADPGGVCDCEVIGNIHEHQQKLIIHCIR